MKNLKKNLFTIGLAFSMMLGVGFSFVPQNARASEIDPGKGELYGNAEGTKYCCKGDFASDCGAATCPF
ncbi:hypothetical protein KCTC32516_00400 [Polaribacter huanghezhanensis]|uniref:hypothetical protein n=1 Tax=Polaribacter huanghezhanensis TaxID=1354726 RepID=UPI002648609D|nr:hypothetical protein [Polaribacter huanghezhanensis]WKD85062.1 hypothetical protein KCTC32516_00400 [Polaribacter huanghezhanensis]